MTRGVSVDRAEDIKILARERRAVILAHSYCLDEVQHKSLKALTSAGELT